MNIIAFETSCDETAVAIYNTKKGLIANVLFSQIKIHEKTGGVVPEIASRMHLEKIKNLTQKALDTANLTSLEIDYVAYTKGPGLIGALLVGAVFATSFAYANKKKIITINHLEGHLLAPFLDKKIELTDNFPFLSVLVSGGHSHIYKVNKIGSYELIGQTLDDAIGEVFDKVAKFMKLGYPGGPLIEELAKKAINKKIIFPRPMQNKDTTNMSFSGLKTHTINYIRENYKTEQDKADIAFAFQAAVFDSLILKIKKSQKITNIKNIIISGGVSANFELRKKLENFAKENNLNIYLPSFEFCTDNAAMIAFAASFNLHQASYSLKADVFPRWSL